MKPHKHAEVIKAWADGHDIQYRNRKTTLGWTDMLTCSPNWGENFEYRVKPQPKPDNIVTHYICYDPAHHRTHHIAGNRPNVKFIFSGDTGELKAVELLQ